MGVKIRIQANSRAEVEQAITYLTTRTNGICKFGKPRQGTNPKYEGRGLWAAYGELSEVIEPPKRGGVI